MPEKDDNFLGMLLTFGVNRDLLRMYDDSNFILKAKIDYSDLENVLLIPFVTNKNPLIASLQ